MANVSLIESFDVKPDYPAFLEKLSGAGFRESNGYILSGREICGYVLTDTDRLQIIKARGPSLTLSNTNFLEFLAFESDNRSRNQRIEDGYRRLENLFQEDIRTL